MEQAATGTGIALVGGGLGTRIACFGQVEGHVRGGGNEDLFCVGFGVVLYVVAHIC